MRLRRLPALLLAAPLALAAPSALAARADRKPFWGPLRVDGKSEFPVYHALGVGIYQMQLSWVAAAPKRPRNPSSRATRPITGALRSTTRSSRRRATTCASSCR